nr:VOC family protein [Eubacterium sp. 1001713B170207_170306_E7]
MKFSFVTIHVNHLEESIRFYEEVLGLEVLRRFEAGPGNEIAFMGSGGAELELIGDAQESEVGVNEKISLGFEIASVDKCMEALREKGIPVFSGPFQPNPKTRFFFIQDPDGVMVELIEQN